MKLQLTALFLFGATLAIADPSFQKVEGKPRTLQSPSIREASGLACSPTDASFFWIINDSGGTNEIHLANTDGTPRGSVIIEGSENKDWEDLTSFCFGGQPHFLIADTGDNAARRESYTLYIIREPDLPADGKSISGSVPLAWKITFTLPNGASADIESIAVDAHSQKIMILTKRSEPPLLLAIPLSGKDQAHEAKQISDVPIKAPILPFVPFRNQPTGMDIAPDNSVAAVITYYGIFLFRREHSQTWAEAFLKRPESLGAHGLPQAEAVAFSKDGTCLYAISEGANSTIIRWQVAE